MQRDASYLTSSFCPAGACVGVGFPDADTVAVTQLQDGQPTTLINFTNPEWEAFIAGAKAGEFDRP